MKRRSLKAWASRLTGEVMVLYHAARDPACPRRLRWLTLALVAYALSPIDLIPDFIPVLGWLDDLIILPLGFAYVMRHMPEPVLVQARAKAQVSGLPPLVQKAASVGQALRWGMLVVGLVLSLVLITGGLLLWALWKALATP